MCDLGADSLYVEFVEECLCDNIEQLRAIEGYCIRKISTLNKVVPNGTAKERYTENNEEIQQQQQICTCNNKGNISEQRKSIMPRTERRY